MPPGVPPEATEWRRHWSGGWGHGRAGYGSGIIGLHVTHLLPDVRWSTVRGNRSKEPPIFTLIQALQETRELASDHTDDPEWQQIHDQVDQVLDRLTEDGGDPITPELGAQRIDRTVRLDEEQAQLAAAAMAALHDRPEPEQVELARAALQQLDDAIG